MFIIPNIIFLLVFVILEKLLITLNLDTACTEPPVSLTPHPPLQSAQIATGNLGFAADPVLHIGIFCENMLFAHTPKHGGNLPLQASFLFSEKNKTYLFSLMRLYKGFGRI